MKRFIIVLYEPGEPPTTSAIRDEIQDMQDLVGGYIEERHITENIVIICNEEGKLKGLPINRSGIVGNFFITKHDEEGDLVSLTDEDIEFSKKWIDSNYVG